ncbi:sigma-70 family RNA polymerase sigma factor [Archangium lansingense]|uniref:Sigma-70 family RNA polymerase sigma factor n=1 Tax=Archangium lansingense TaxID=2995310 RepID=A0ABT4AC37_9BACT|nr:sigma-70 family RNA polymerase sigma factor [Archangium lansinium]MCY1078799.1 sigma-70 family RNA polymerase sigma factor [Archangium lansinium]
MAADPILTRLSQSGLSPEEAQRLREALRRAVEVGRSAWPALGLPDEAFLQHVVERLPAGKDGVAALESLHVEDLYLACACARGLPKALESFEERLGPQVDAAVRSLRGPSEAEEDVRQVLWEKLFVGAPGRPAKISEYAGRGPLGGWVRIAAVRTGLNLRERRDAEPRSDEPELLDHPTPDPEVAFFKRHYRAELKEALEAAIASLPSERRNVLRLYFVDGLSIDKLGAVYGIHRATAARWVAAARQEILETTCRRLSERLRVDGSEMESILRMVRSQLDFNLGPL